MMTDFTPISGLIGGALIGTASVILLLVNGRIAGISGIFGGLLSPLRGDTVWRLVFVIGLVLGGTLWPMMSGHTVPFEMPAGVPLIITAGVLVGFGARMAGGCTSGHAVCGIARRSRRSIAATAIFMVSAVLIVRLMRGA